MMKKRLTAWLLVLCMTLSLLPGTAFAASGGNDGTITVYYDLNDGGKSPYLMKMTTNPDQEPPIHPGAVWAGRPFAGWAGDRAGSKAAEFKDGATLYAQWQSGYEISLCYNKEKDTNPGDSTTPPPPAVTYDETFTTDNNGKLKERDLGKVDAAIQAVEELGKYTFMGWYVVDNKGEYEKDDLFTKKLTTDTVIPTNGLKLYGKWETVYTIKFDYDKANSGQENSPIKTTTGGILSEMPETPNYKDFGYEFEAWYVIEDPNFPNSIPGADDITKGQLARGADGNLLATFKRGVRIPHEQLSSFSFTKIAAAMKESGQLTDNTITLVANWKLPAGIIFHANGGRFGTDTNNYRQVIRTDNDGVLHSVPDPAPNLDPEYKFRGWYTEDSFVDGSKFPNANNKLKTDVDPDETVTEITGRADKFTGPETVYAAWEKLIKVTIRYGTGSIDPVVLYVKKGEMLATKDYNQHLKDKTVDGHTIEKEWYVFPDSATLGSGGIPTDPDEYKLLTLDAIQTYTFTEDTTIRAQLTPGYHITFWSVDPADSSKETMVHETTTNTYGYLLETDLPTANPTYPNGEKTFKGWGIDGKPLTLTTYSGNIPAYVDPNNRPFTAEQKVCAIWGAPYKISFDLHGGSFATGDTPADPKTDKDGYISAEVKRLTPNPPTSTTKTYVFDGWYLDAEYKTPVNDSTPACTTPPTLHAKWKEVIANTEIEYILTDTSLVTDATQVNFSPTSEQERTTSSGTYPDPLPIPTHTTSTIRFQGWYTTNQYDQEVKGGNPVFDNLNGGTKVKLFAKWIAGGSTYSVLSRPTSMKPASFAAASPTGDALLAAPLAAAPYTITFNFNYKGQTPIASTTQNTDANGHLSALPECPESAKNEGYVFKGWFTTAVGGTQVTTSTTFTEPMEVFAHWEQTVTFYPTDGRFSDGALSKQAETTGGKLPAKDRPETPTRDGYSFAGWYTTADNTGTKVDWDSSDPEFPAPAKLYAHWELLRFAVTFDDGVVGNTDYVAYTNETGNVVLPTTNPSRPGYTFGGWYTAAEGGTAVTAATVFNRDTTVHAHWTKDIEITFDHNGGTGGPQVIKVGTGGTLEKQPVDPKRAGYKFTGWYDAPSGGNRFDGSSTFTADATYYANWEAATWTITWNLNDDATNPASPSVITSPSETVNGYIPSLPTPAPTRRGYRFDGWVVEGYAGDNLNAGDTVTTTTPIYADIKLKAAWVNLADPPLPKTPVITFIVDISPVADDAAHFTLETNNAQKLEQLPVLEGLGKVSGWRLEDGTTSVTEAEVYNENTNLYVNIAKTHLITFDWNNAKDGGTSTTTTVRTNEAGQIDADKWPDNQAKEKNPGYQFDGWYDKADDTGKLVPKLTIFTEPTTIYAHWKGPFTITFDANGGKFSDGEITKGVETDEDGNLDGTKIPADPTREGYTKFGGWSTTKDGTEAVQPDAKPYTGAATLYAIWGPPYTITYDVMGGNELTPTDAQKLTTEDGKYPELPVPTHSRDAFDGWYTTKDYQAGTQATAGGDCPGAVTLYAKWKREPPYTITFDANRPGATLEDPVTGVEGSTVTLTTDKTGVLPKPPADPKSRGDTFAGWFTEKEEGESVGELATHVFSDDMTLYAHWGTMDFTITFDYNLSQIMDDPLNITTTATAANGALTYLPNNTLPQAASGDYEIEAWYKVPNPGKNDKPVTKGDIVHRDTTLYAKWKKASKLPIVFEYPNITFMDENNKPLITLEVEGYKMAQLPQLPYKEGYTAAGWVTRAPDGTETPLTADTQITGSVTAYPKYTEIAKTYTITFEPGAESELEPVKVTTTADGRIPDGQIPTDLQWEGHTFSGWYTAATGGTRITRRTVFTADATVYAHWDAADNPDNPNNPDDPNNPDNPDNPDRPGPTSPPFTITFNPNGGNLNASATALTDMDGRLMSLPTPARTGYHFDGWYNGTERVTTATVFSGNATITAQWNTGSGSGGSGGSDSGDVNGYNITVSNTTGGRVSVSTTYAREGDRVTVTVRPYSGYQLDRVDVVNARGNDVELRDQGSNRYVFYMPASRVTVDAVFMELVANNGNGGNTGSNGNTGNTGNTGSTGNGSTSWNPGGNTGGATSGMGVFSQPVLNTVPMPYLDVLPSDWYYSSVDYMWQRQLMGGVSSNRFGPQATTSNAMVWTILARLAGVDVTSGASVWYENARSWAVSNRISDGVGPNSPVTREQLALMLWNFSGSPAAGYDLGQFGDRGQISTYQAECALRWAVANHIVTGTGNRLNPRGTATRAEVAAMITRFCQNT